MASPQTDASPLVRGRFILLHPDDNILICIEGADPGAVVEIDGIEHTLEERIELGHKIARRHLRRGERVSRYGSPIGSMTADAKPAEHVHSHNLASDYIPAHGRGVTGGKEICS